MLLVRLSSLVTLTSLSLSLLPGSIGVLAESDSVSNASKHRYESHTATGDLVCRPFGECEPCPVDELHRPYCHPYGNRRLVHCIPHSHLSSSDPSQSSNADPVYSSDNDPLHNLNQTGHNTPHVIGNQEGLEGNGDGRGDGKGKAGEIPAWASCGKVVALERAGFGVFVTTNTLFLIVSLFILMLRANKLAAVQYRALAAKIGIGGSVV